MAISSELIPVKNLYGERSTVELASGVYPELFGVEPKDRKDTAVASPLLIGIGHQKRIGKDTFAEMLSERLDKTYCTLIHGFADIMKEDAFSLFYDYGLGDSDYYIEHPEEKDAHLFDSNLTPRDIWIIFARTMRNIDEDVWIKKLDEATKPLQKTDVVIIPDVRYENEADFIRSRGGILVKLYNPDIPVDADGADDQLLDFDDWDFEFLNDFKLKTLKKHAKKLTKHIKGILTNG